MVVVKGVQAAINKTHLKVGPKADDPREPFKPLLSGFLWHTKRSRVSGVTVVFVQGLRNKFQIPLLESLTPFAHQFDLWGAGVVWVGHWDETTVGGFPWGPRGESDAGAPGSCIMCLQARS